MVPLVKMEDSGYKPIDPSLIRLPPPQPPKRKPASRFSSMLATKGGKKSFLLPPPRPDQTSFLKGRGSIAWEAPRASTAR